MARLNPSQSPKLFPKLTGQPVQIRCYVTFATFVTSCQLHGDMAIIHCAFVESESPDFTNDPDSTFVLQLLFLLVL